jgi:hypothetical protein
MSGNSSQTDLTQRFIEISLSLIRIERKLRATASGSYRPADSQPPYIIHIIASAAYGRDHNLLSPHFVDGPFRLRITCPVRQVLSCQPPTLGGGPRSLSSGCQRAGSGLAAAAPSRHTGRLLACERRYADATIDEALQGSRHEASEANGGTMLLGQTPTMVGWPPSRVATRMGIGTFAGCLDELSRANPEVRHARAGAAIDLHQRQVAPATGSDRARLRPASLSDYARRSLARRCARGPSRNRSACGGVTRGMRSLLELEVGNLSTEPNFDRYLQHR